MHFRIFDGEFKDPDFTDGLNQIRGLLISDLDASVESVAIIESYGWWLMDHSASDGIRVFMEAKAADSLDSDKILGKLDTYGNAPAQTYLEYLVQGKGSGSPEHHTRLACSYAQDVQLAMADPETVEVFKKMGEYCSLC